MGCGVALVVLGVLSLTGLGGQRDLPQSFGVLLFGCGNVLLALSRRVDDGRQRLFANLGMACLLGGLGLIGYHAYTILK